MPGTRGPISRSFIETPLVAGVWVSDIGLVVAANGVITVVPHHHLRPSAARTLATMLAEASDWLDSVAE